MGLTQAALRVSGKAFVFVIKPLETTVETENQEAHPVERDSASARRCYSFLPFGKASSAQPNLSVNGLRWELQIQRDWAYSLRGQASPSCLGAQTF